jgi:hypothetical protein
VRIAKGTIEEVYESVLEEAQGSSVGLDECRRIICPTIFQLISENGTPGVFETFLVVIFEAACSIAARRKEELLRETIGTAIEKEFDRSTI